VSEATFSQYPLHERLLKALDQHGFHKPTEVQSATVEPALAGKDLLVSAETGSGKTAAFLIPTLHKLMETDAPKAGTRALILTPTRELARQIVKHCKQLVSFSRIQVDTITGGADFKYQRSVFRKNPEIIVATPGRLIEHIERGSPDFADLEVLILDEADRMLDMGFAEDVETIAKHCNSERQTLLFSATLDNRKAAHVITDLLTEPEAITLAKPRQLNENIQQQKILSDDEKFKRKQLQKLLELEEFHKALIFTNTKAQTSKLAGWLKYLDYNVGVLHGDMNQDARNDEMNRLRRGRVNILVATDVAARGLDVKGIELVVHFELARNSEDYIHRSGRTGRSGEQGKSIALIAPWEWNLLTMIEKQVGEEFELRKLPGLESKFKKPGKAKPAKKAVKKKDATKKKSASANKPGDKANKPKQRHRDQKNKGKRRAPAANDQAKSIWGDGFAAAPIKKKPSKDLDE
jgi:superfamily II DNA/RNA helicase